MLKANKLSISSPTGIPTNDAEVIVEQVFADLFDNSLLAWHTDESAWPKNRDLKMFREWFAIEFHSIVEDLCDYEIFDEDIE